MRKQKGFSLIELLIVVAIILIIAAIAIPNLMRSKIAANEASAISSIRTIVTAQTTYATTYPELGFATTLAKLGPSSGTPTSNEANLIDSVLASGSKSGYTIATQGTATTFFAQANPTTPGTTGIRSFCAATDGVIKYQSSTIAASTCTGNPAQ